MSTTENEITYRWVEHDGERKLLVEANGFKALVEAPHWEPGMHPRGRAGRFIEVMDVLSRDAQSGGGIQPRFRQTVTPDHPDPPRGRARVSRERPVEGPVRSKALASRAFARQNSGHGAPEVWSKSAPMGVDAPGRNADGIDTAKLAGMSVDQIAWAIERDWGPKVNFGARPYLDAMKSLGSVDEDYGMDSGSMIVAYFLSNATTWRGPTAKAVKAELKKRLGRK